MSTRRYDEIFSAVLRKIADRKNQLKSLDLKLAALAKEKRSKGEKIKLLERKLVSLLEAQESALNEIRQRQEMKEISVVRNQTRDEETKEGNGLTNLMFKDNRKISNLMSSTEAMMKFGFMNMGMTYFTSLNMVKAIRAASNYDENIIPIEENEDDFDSQEVRRNDDPLLPTALKWSVDDVSKWLSKIALSQYKEVFRDGSIDGPFLFQLSDEDLRNVLGVEHPLHRKKILFSVKQLGHENSKPKKYDESTKENVSLTLIKSFLFGTHVHTTQQIENEERGTFNQR